VSSLAAIGIGLLAAAQWAFLAYFVALSVVYLTLNVLAFRAVRSAGVGYDSAETRHPYSGLEPPISLLLPAFDEELTIAASVTSLLQLFYSEFEVIVISDGSRDGTLAAMTRAFDLQSTPYSLPGAIPTALVRSVYTSRQFPNLRVIDKAHGGKADALNAGVNAARYPLFCAVAADSIFERDSLSRVVWPFQEDPHVIAAGGTVRLANGCRASGGFLEGVGLPHKVLPLFQIVENLRAFLFGGMGWSPLNAVLIVAGAFGVFRRTSVIDAGGYRHDTIGEDMELVVRLHRLHRTARRPYRIRFVPDPICWTKAPEDLHTLRAQRTRWQQGLLESLWLNRGLLFHRHGGAAGWLAFPVMLLFEALAPVVEVGGYLVFAVGWASGAIDGTALAVFALLAISVGFLFSANGLLLEQLSFHVYPRAADLAKLIGAALLENVGYRQLSVLWRLQGTWRWLRGKVGHWGARERPGGWPGGGDPRDRAAP